MNIEKYLENINGASKEIFHIPVPIDRLQIFTQDVKSYQEQAVNALNKEVFGSFVAGNSLAFMGSLQEVLEEFYAIGGFHTLRLDNGQLASDITILMNSQAKNSGNSLDDISEKYEFIEKLAHEIGHAVMEYNVRRGFIENRVVKKFALVFGQVNELQRELYAMLPQDQKNKYATMIVKDIEYNKKSIEWDMKNLSYETFNALMKLKTYGHMSDILDISAKSESQYAELRKQRNERANRLRIECGEDEDFYHDECKKLLDEFENKRRKKLIEDTEENNKSIQKTQQEIVEKEVLLNTLRKLPPMQEKLLQIFKKYDKFCPYSRVNSEGWAVFYSNKIMESMVSKIFVRQNQNVHPDEFKQLLQLSPDDSELDNYPELQIHVAKTNQWLNRSDCYGEGFRFYNGLSVNAAKVYAFKKK